jgi:hypothetical protein
LTAPGFRVSDEVLVRSKTSSMLMGRANAPFLNSHMRSIREWWPLSRGQKQR